MKVLITPTSLQPGKSDAALTPLYDKGYDCIFNPYGRPLTEEELIPLIKDVDGMIAGLDFITKDVCAAAKKLKVISRYGAGFDRVDLDAAKQANIIVTNTPGANAHAVAELAFGLLLSVARNISHLNQTTKEGSWERSTGIELYQKTMGIIGLGAIGKNLASCAQGFGMNVVSYDPLIDEAYCKEHQIVSMSFEDVLKNSHVISLHLPLNEQTHHLIDKAAIEKMPQHAILINAARGGIIDEEAAYQALVSGKLAGLGLDAFEKEPPQSSPLFELPNVVVTPHTGAHTREATERMASMAVSNLLLVLSEKDCPYTL